MGKYHVCKRAPNHAYEALECLGGNGYVEASGMPRLYREAPLGSIWEGSGNVMALDVLRALARAPTRSTPSSPSSTSPTGPTRAWTRSPGHPRALASPARRAAGPPDRRAPCALPAGVAARAPRPGRISDAFCAARLDGDAGLAYGTLPAGVDGVAIVARHTPPV